MDVRVSLSSMGGSVPIAYKLYLREDWAMDAVRCQGVSIHVDIAFATKLVLALGQMRQAFEQDMRSGAVC